MINRKKYFTVVLPLVFVSLMLGLFVSQKMSAKKNIDFSQFNGTLLQQPRPIKSFKLAGVDNQVFDNQALQGHWTMMFFGFTNCGHVCPTTMAELAKMYRSLEEKNIHPLPQVVLISVDPERDSIKKLKDYTQAFHPNFYAARGDNKNVEIMAREMGIAYVKVALSKTDVSKYDVQHTGAIMLFNPKGELTAFFTTPHQADLLVNDYKLLVS